MKKDKKREIRVKQLMPLTAADSSLFSMRWQPVSPWKSKTLRTEDINTFCQHCIYIVQFTATCLRTRAITQCTKSVICCNFKLFLNNIQFVLHTVLWAVNIWHCPLYNVDFKNSKVLVDKCPESRTFQCTYM